MPCEEGTRMGIHKGDDDTWTMTFVMRDGRTYRVVGCRSPDSALREEKAVRKALEEPYRGKRRP